jgi:predicted metal-binding membrane protein
MTNYANATTNGNLTSPALAGRVRLILGLTMMIAGLYFGLFTALPGHGLGLLFFIVSPFVFLTDKKS